MKKRKLFIMLLIILILIVFLSLFTFAKTINAEYINLRINSAEFDGNDQVFEFENVKMMDDINNVISGKLYYKQPFIQFWSRREINYEINLYEYSTNKMVRYRILINENEDEHTLTGYKSRVDVIVGNHRFDFLDDEYSLRLSTNQTDQILEILKKYQNTSMLE